MFLNPEEQATEALWGRKGAEVDMNSDIDLDADFSEPADGELEGGNEPGVAESHFSDIDPSTLPPELQGVYKSLQKDYTQKTQGLASERKMMADRKAQIAWLEQVDTLAKTDPKRAAMEIVRAARYFDPNIPEYGGQAPAQNAPGAEPDIDWDGESEGTRYIFQALQKLIPVLQTIGTQVGEATQYVATAKQEREMDALSKEFGEFDEQALLAEAKKYPAGTPMKLVLSSILLSAAKEQASSDVYGKMEFKKEATQPMGAHTPAEPAAPTTFADYWNQAKRQLKLKK
jgi:hypothetical protein